MARTATRPAVALALFAALPLVAACAAPEPGAASASDHLPTFGWAPRPRMRTPSSERPAWLPFLPSDPPRIPAPGDAFRA